MAFLIGNEFGGPSAATVFQNRLIFVGSGVSGDLVMASKTGDWDDMRTGETNESGEFISTDEDGFRFLQNTVRNTRFVQVAQQEGLFLLGDIGESVIPAGEFTGTTAQVRENSWYGSDPGRPVLLVGSQLIFIQAGGNDIRMINWSEEQRKYEAPSMITLSGPVFDRAVDMAFQTSGGDRPDTIYVVDADGSLAVAVFKDMEPRLAWAKWETDGHVLSAASIFGDTTFLVDRDGEIALEWLDDDAVTDGDAEFDREIETVPFISFGRAGAKNAMRPTRIHRASISFFGNPPDELPCMVRIGGPDTPFELEVLEVEKETSGNAHAIMVGLGGWDDRQTLTIQFKQPVMLSGISLKGKG